MTPRLAARLIKLTLICAAFFFLFLLYDLLFPFRPKIEFSKVVYDRNGSLLSAFLTSDDKWRMRSKLSEISPELVKAILHKEDRWFFAHPGVNAFALIRALSQNIYSQSRVSGASTITMQLCRMLKPASRNYFNKTAEIIRALQLELHFSKAEILEMYLSLLPYGSNIEGIKSASYIYFQKPPGRLSLAQSIMLAVIPNNPNLLRPDKKGNAAMNFRDRWIRNFSNDRLFSEKELKVAMQENDRILRGPVPVKAPHFSIEISKHCADDLVYTTLDYRVQYTLENILANQARQLAANGITNCAALILDNKRHEVVAYCGSADFSDSRASGQINGINASRSPGSTLKPALYAMALDAGLITPRKKLLDVPLEINGYEPENFDRDFNGFLTAADALKKSLNVPAVRLLQQIELTNFTDMMVKAGISDFNKNRGKHGLALILGGCSVTLQELTTLFSAFANKGFKYHYKTVKSEPENIQPVKLFSAAASYLIAEILSSSDQSDFGLGSLSVLPRSRFAWKTGTSFGKKDAWAVGFNTRYTVGVWAGNFDCSGAANLIGIRAAVPILNTIFENLPNSGTDEWFGQPAEIKVRAVCPESGSLPNGYCDSTYDYYIDAVSNNQRCDIDVPLLTNGKDIQYCRECMPDSGYTEKVFRIYPPELVNWYAKSGVKITLPPRHNPACTALNRIGKVQILSPSASFEYLIENADRQQIPLEFAATPDVVQVYWFVDGKLLGSAKPAEKLFWKPLCGAHRVICLTDGGISEYVDVRVKTF